MRSPKRTSHACFTHAPSAVRMRFVCCAEAARTHCAFTLGLGHITDRYHDAQPA